MAIRKESHKIIVAVLVTYLLLSFVPQLGLLSLWSHAKGAGPKP